MEMVYEEKKPVIMSMETCDEVFGVPISHIKLVLENPNNIYSVIYKVRPCSPRVFLVQPGGGVLRPNTEVTVDIFEEYGAENDGERCSFSLMTIYVIALQDLPNHG